MLVAWTALAVLLIYLDQKDVSIFFLSEGKAFSGLLGFTAAILAIYEFTLLIFAVSVRMNKGAPSEIPMMASLLRFGMGAMFIAALLYYTGKLSGSWAAVAPFIGLMLGWSLQSPISGLAAWVMVTVKRPFRIGDRVLLPSLGLVGDVQQMGMMYTVLNQVGGTVGTEDAIGRYILLPNAMLFSNVVINYTPQQASPFVLDEVVVRITYDSDWKAAEEILLNAASAVTGDIIKETGQAPYIRSDLYDYGVYLRLRYTTQAKDRPRIVHEITQMIFREFQSNPHVDFAIPYVYSYRMGMQSGRRVAGNGNSINGSHVEEIDMNLIVGTSVGTNGQGIDQDVEDMASKIAQNGLAEPIVVERRPNGAFEVIAGELCLRACKHLGWKTIKAVVIGGKPDDISQSQTGIEHGPVGPKVES